MKKPIDIIHAKQEYIKDWKERIQEAQKIAPIIDKIEEVTNWEEQALTNLPDEADEIPMVTLNNDLEMDYQQFTKSLPMPPRISTQFVSQNTTAGTITSASSTFEFVSRVGDLRTPMCRAYSSSFINAYYGIQKSQNRGNEVRQFILRLNNSNLLQRFDECIDSISRLHLSLEKKESTANFIRNLINGIKGELFERARNKPGENMTWEKMATRLSINDNGKKLIIRQELVKSNLLSRTADALKNILTESETNIDFIWTQTIDHLFIVLNNIKIH